MELEIAVVQEGAAPTRFFFWSPMSSASPCPFEESALQAVHFLQSLYGFVVRDYNYEEMLAYRNLARSAIVLAVSVVRAGTVASTASSGRSVGSFTESASCQVLCNQLISSVCNM